MVIKKCEWCGKPLRYKYNSKKYHKKCEKYAKQERKRIYHDKYYKRWKNRKNKLGNTNLRNKVIPNEKEEHKAIRREMKRLGLLKKT